MCIRGNGRRAGKTPQVLMENQIIILISSLVIKLLVHGVGGSILAVGKIDQCVRVKNDWTLADINCTQKIIVTLTVVSNSKGESDTIQAFLTDVNDEKGENRRFTQPYKIVVQKSPVQYRFPLEYIQNYNGQPYEYAAVAVNCKDDENDENPSCGWMNNKDGRIKDSQGFCCTCSYKEGRSRWFGRKGSKRRFDVKCNAFLKFFGKNNGSCHCLRMSDRWYPTFKVVEHLLYFTIDVKITLMDATQGADLVELDDLTETLRVEPSALFAINEDRNVRVRLQGDLQNYRQAPMIYDRYLSIPYVVNTNNYEPDPFNWLLVEKGRYANEGDRTCDKIGTSYTAFRYQPGACAREAQSCLANQLDALKKIDVDRRNAGLRPLYSITQYGIINTYQERGLSLQATDSLTSILTLELTADNVTFFINKSPGKILKAEIKNFEAFSRNGVLSVEVKNIGDLSADFMITFSNCSDGILPPNALPLSLPLPAVVTSFQFQLHTTDDKALTRTCRLNLLDAVGDVTDTSQITFATTTTKYDNKSQDFIGEPKKLKNETGGWDFGLGWLGGLDFFGWLKLMSCDECHLPNIFCFIFNFCWGELISIISSIVTVVLVGVGIYLLWSSGLLMPLIRLLFLPLRICCSLTSSVVKSSAQSKSRRDSDDSSNG
ncbi:hypothetical protein R1flu_025291 [Riccia fluitans]|uniref:Generative cell specific-1/HAP2 domain-containing protein n=1 Tax=Riccia fluitans TaxID=41844 RepID=A0ABD1XXD5_9MARC